MNSQSSHIAVNADTLHDVALRRARELRREAIRDFWRGADAVWAGGVAAANRSAQRLAHRLAHHVRQRRRAAASGKVIE